MSEVIETPVTPEVPVAPPETPEGATGPTGTPEGATGASGEKKTPWFQTRIDQVTRQKYEAERVAEAAKAENEKLRQQLKTGIAPQQISPDEVERLVEERSQQRTQQRQFDERCNQVYQAGKKDIPDFDAALSNFSMFGGLGAHPALVQATTMLPDGHKVLHHLGSNLDEAARVLSLPPMQMAMEIGLMANKLKTQAPKVSNAPPPVTPLNGGWNAGEPGPDQDGNFKTQADFRAWREKQKARKQ